VNPTLFTRCGIFLLAAAQRQISKKIFLKKQQSFGETVILLCLLFSNHQLKLMENMNPNTQSFSIQILTKLQLGAKVRKHKSIAVYPKESFAEGIPSDRTTVYTICMETKSHAF